MADLVKFLREKTLRQIIRAFPTGIVEGKTVDSAEEGFKKLMDNNISSIPLHDGKKGYVAFMDILDILFYVTKDDIRDLENDNKLKTVTCGKLANYSELDAFLQIPEETNLIKVLQIVCHNFNLHRFPVTNTESKLIGIVSQSQLVHFLEPHTSKFDFGNSTIGQLGLGLEKVVVTVSENDSVMKAIQTLKEHKVTGIGVVNSNGQLIGNFSASDLKMFGIGFKILNVASGTMKDFIAALQIPKHIHYPVTVTKAHTAQKVVSLIKETGVHRVYIVDDKKPIGIISLVDILELFFRHLLIE